MINYPNPKKAFKKAAISVKNRGMQFETIIDESNAYYLESGKAVIYKKPTPVQIVRVDYPSRSHAKIVEAYYKTPSTTDYNGIYNKMYIDFDVKESHNKTSFPLKNIHPHQLHHLDAVSRQGGIAFLLIYIKIQDAIYLMPYENIAFFVKRAQAGRKSITHEEIQSHSFLVKEGLNPRIDYLSAVDAYIKKKSANKTK